MAHKTYGRRISESGGGLSRGGLVGGSSVQLRKRDKERNQDVDPRLRVMERFQEFFNPVNKDVRTCPNRVNSR